MSTVLDPQQASFDKQLRFHLDSSGIADTDKIRVWNALANGADSHAFQSLADSIPNFPADNKINIYNLAYTKGPQPTSAHEATAWDYVKGMPKAAVDVGKEGLDRPGQPLGEIKTGNTGPIATLPSLSGGPSPQSILKPAFIGGLTPPPMVGQGRAQPTSTTYDTALTPQEEAQFKTWKATYAPGDSGEDYDLRGAFKAGFTPSADGHWPDTFKKPNHPTFSDESVYAVGPDAAKAGRWEGAGASAKFIPPANTGDLSEQQRNFWAPPPAAPPATDSKVLGGFPTLAEAKKNRLIQSPQDLFAVAANAASGFLNQTTLGAYDPENGTINIPITGGMLYRLRDKPLSQILEEDIGARPEVASATGARAVGAFAGAVAPWMGVSNVVEGALNKVLGPVGAAGLGRVETTLNEVFGPSASKFAAGVVRRLMTTLGTAAVVGTLEPKPPDEAKAEQVANTMAFATVMHLGAEAIGAGAQAYQALPWKPGSARPQTMGDLIDTIKQVVMNERPDATEQDASDYAAKIVKDEINKQGGWQQITQKWLKDVLARAKQRANTVNAEFTGEEPAPTQLPGEAPKKADVLSSEPVSEPQPPVPSPPEEGTGTGVTIGAQTPQESLDRPPGGWGPPPVAGPPAVPAPPVTTPPVEVLPPSDAADVGLGDRWHSDDDMENIGERAHWLDGTGSENAKAVIRKSENGGGYQIETPDMPRPSKRFATLQEAATAAESLFPIGDVAKRVPPTPIPEPATPFDHVVYQTADTYLDQVRDLVRSGSTEMAGKTYRDHPDGPIIGRFGGGFKQQFPFLDHFDESPGEIASAIDAKQGFLHTRLRTAAIKWVRENEGDGIKEYIKGLSPEEIEGISAPAHDFKVGDRVQADEGPGEISRVTPNHVKISLDSGGKLTHWIPVSRVTRLPPEASKPALQPPPPVVGPRPDLKTAVGQALDQGVKPPSDLQAIKDRLKARGARGPSRATTPPPITGGDSTTYGRSAPGLDDLDDQDRDDLIALGAHQYRETPSRAAWHAAMVDAIGDWAEPYLPQLYTAFASAMKERVSAPPPAFPPPPPGPPAPEEPAPRPPPVETGPPVGEPGESEYATLSRWILDKLVAGESMDNPMLTTMANQVFGGTRGEGKYDPRDSYDSVEVAVNMYIQRPGIVGFNDVSGTLGRLRKLTSQLPTQADRTHEQVEFQQFSTPPEEAFVTVLAMGIKPGMFALEPSGGTGTLATMMRLAGAIVHTNEINPRRQEMLRLLKFPVTTVDAQFLNSLLPDEIRPDVIDMNPPFSATGGRTKSHDTMNGADHVTEALARLNPGGRLVAIVGRGMAHDRPTFSKWWDDLEQRYNVRANIGIDGKYYQKYGTGFDNQILVIDKTGPTPGANRAERLSNIIKASGLSPEEAIQLLQPLGKEDVQSRLAGPEQSGNGPTGTLRPGGGPGLPGPVSTDIGGPAGGQRTGEPPAGIGGTGRGAVGPVDNAPQPGPAVGGIHPPPSDAEGRPAGTEEPGGPLEVGGGGGGGDAGRPGVAGGLEVAKPAEAKYGEADTANYQKYIVTKAVFPGAHPHAADMVESATLASVEMPEPTYKLHLPDEVVTEGRLSDIQLEAVLYAGQRHQIDLPDGRRAGYWDGDGTGSGKGRMISGIFYDNFNQGRRRGAWISYSQQMKAQTKLDLSDVGYPLDLILHNDTEADDELPDKDGVLFTTYGFLAGEWKGDRRRYNQLLQWIGDRKDPVITFDEGHNMKNAVAAPGAGQQQGQQDAGSDQGAMGLALDAEYPRGVFSYFSATGATVPRNMAYMSRLGMWGAGSPFPTFQDFLAAMTSGGLGAMEMLARDLKAVGAFMSRSISYKGIEYGQLVHQLTPDEITHYNRMGDVWNEVQLAFDAAATKAKSRSKNHRWASQFGSSQQRFFLQVMTSLQLPDLFEAADKDIAEGRAVVISLYSTNEGQVSKKVNEARASGAGLEDLDLTPRDILLGFIEKFFPVEQWTTRYDPATGRDEPVQVLDAEGNPVLNKENLAKRAELLDMVADIYVPENPLDAIINHFGPHRIAEVSGRMKRLEGNQYVARKFEDAPIKDRNIHELARFQDGKVNAIVLTGAGGAGISAHASIKAKNQRRRVQFAMQVPWSADKQQQMVPGRTHRSNQVSAPIVRLVRTSLASQERLINTVSARLASAGALTEGSRESKSGGLFAIQDLTDSYGQAALGQVYSDITANRVPNIVTGPKMLERMGLLKRDAKGNLGVMQSGDTANVDRFLNRIMALHVDEQNAIFELFYRHYQEGIEAAKQNETFDPGVTKVQGTDITLSGRPTTLYTDRASKAETRLITLEGAFPTGRYSWDALQPRLGSASTLGLYANKRSGRIYLASTRDTQAAPVIDMVSPSGASHTIPVQGGSALQTIADGHARIRDAATAQEAWTKEYEATPAYTRRPIFMITGAIFPIYDKVVGVETQHLQNVRVVRAVLNSGASYIGLQIRQGEINGLKQRLGIGVALAKASGAQVFEMIKNGASIVLDNDWRIKMGKVHREDRMELKVKVPNRDELLRLGLFDEIVGSVRRYFIPLDDQAGPAVLEKILAAHKAIRDETTSGPPGVGGKPSSGGDEEAGRQGGKGLPDLAGPEYAGPVPRTIAPPPAGGATTGQAQNAAQAAQQQSGTSIMSKQEILKQLSQGLGIPLRVGRFRGKNVLGIFKVRQETARSKQALDLSTYFHEAGGHAVNKILWGTAGKGGALRLNHAPLEPFRSELDPLATKPRKGQDTLPEGFAEFMRMYIESPDLAKQLAPAFYPFLENELHSHPDLEDTLKAAQENVKRWKQQPATARILSHISVGEDTAAKSNSWRKFYRGLFDQFDAVEQAMKEAGPVNVEDDAYKLIRLYAGWMGKATHALEHGTFDLVTYAINGPSLQEILKPIRDRLDDWRVYAVSRRVIEKTDQGIDTGFSPLDAREAVRALDSPEMRWATDAIHQFEDWGLAYLRERGIISAEGEANIRKLNQDYVPLYRVMEATLGEGTDRNSTGKSGTFADLWSPVRRMKGSGRMAVDPLESIIKNTYMYIRIGEQNRIGLALVDLAAKNEGFGKFVEGPLPPPMRPVTFVLDRIKQDLEAAGVDPDTVDIDHLATLFVPASKLYGKDNVISVLVNGQQKFYQLDPDLFKALEAMDEETVSWLVRLLALPSNMLRLGATSLSPDFALLRGPLRDALTAMMQSNHGFKPGIDTWRGLFHVVGRTEMYWEWMRSGGAYGSMAALDRPGLQQKLKDLLSSPFGYMFHHPIEALRMFGETSLAISRVGEYALARQQGSSPEEAAFDSRNVIADYARHGNATKAIRLLYAFWSPSLQHLDRTVETYREHPGRSMMRGSMLTLASLLLYLWNRKDDAYQELPWYVKDFLYVASTKGTPLERYIPFMVIASKPGLFGMIHSSIPERVFDWIDKRDPSAFSDLEGTLLHSIPQTPVWPPPQFLRPISEAWANRSLLTGRPLMPTWMEKLPPEDRYEYYTSEIAKLLAKGFDSILPAGHQVSPIQIDVVTQGYTGGVGKLILDAMNPAIRAARGTIQPPGAMADLPLLDALTTRYPTGELQSVSRFYNRLQELQQRQAAMRESTLTQSFSAPPMSAKDMNDFAELSAAAKVIAAERRDIRDTLYDPTRSPQERRNAVIESEIAIANAARHAIDVTEGRAERPELKVPLSARPVLTPPPR